MRIILVFVLSCFFQEANAQFTSAKHLYDSNVLNPSCPLIDDINGDGHKDVIAPLTGSNKVVWYPGDGTVNYGEQKLVSANAVVVYWIKCHDFDGDGDVDVAYINSTDDIISWSENDGSGNFVAEHTVHLGSGTENFNKLYLVDIDDDGLTDIVANEFNFGNVVWFKNLGNGQFGNLTFLFQISTFSFSVSDLTHYDFDGDGDDDIFTTCDNSLIGWYENLGNGVFGAQQIVSNLISSPTQIDITDLNGDGALDIVVLALTPGGHKVILLPRTGPMQFGAHITLVPNLLYPKYALYEDFDGDGDPDVSLTLGFSGNKIIWYANDGLGNFSNQQIIREIDVPTGLVASDIDDDGDMDLISAASGIGTNELVSHDNVNGLGTFDPFKFGRNAYYEIIRNSDVDLDGDLDLIYSESNYNSVSYLENNGQGNFSLPISLIDIPAVDVWVDDIDNDNIPDYLISNGGGVTIYKNDGTGSIIDTITVADTIYTWNVRTADFDNDGYVDILLNSYLDELVWFKNNGAATFSISYIIQDSISPYSRSSNPIDFDNDGDIDVIRTMTNPDAIFWIENSSSGTAWTEHLITTIPNNPIEALGADLNGDGFTDVVSISDGDDALRIMVNSGNNSTFGLQTIFVGSYLGGLSLVDVNGDGYVDITTFDGITDETLVFMNDGNGLFPNPIILSLQSNITSFNYADANNDGSPDLLIGGGHLSLVENQFSSFNFLSGNVYYDANQNLTLDGSDYPIPFSNVMTSPLNQLNLSYNDGHYQIGVADTGTYIVSPPSISGWSLSTIPAAYSVQLGAATPSADSLDFGFFYDSIFTDISTELIGGFPRCNTNSNFWLNLTNKGSTIGSGVIRLELDPNISIIAAQVAPDSIVGNSIYFHYDSLYSFANYQIEIAVQYPNFTFSGSTLSSVLEVIDSNGVSFSDSLHQILVCAYDPNDKSVTPTGYGSNGYIKPDTPYLDYLVRFQNTGNDTALFVMIEDQLSPYLDHNQFEFLSSSHATEVIVNSYGLVKFKFHNIQLPDSTTNYLQSMGYVSYRVPLIPNLPIGTKINNTAEIYFDFNPAVITNTVLNTIDLCFDAVTADLAISNFDTLCSNSSPVTLPIGTPANGNYSGTGVTTNEFDPSVAGQGTHMIYYNFFDTLSGCSTSDSLQLIVVTAEMANSSFDTLCSNSSSITLPIGTPSGGIYYGPGVTMNEFDPSLAGQGIHTIYYTFLEITTGCSTSDSLQLTVVSAELPNSSFDTLCSNSSSITLPIGTPVGGYYSGLGVTVNEFNPSLAGQGTHTIYYTYIDPTSGCTTSDSMELVVVTCLGIDDHILDFIYVYPNPARNSATIEFGSQQSIYTLEVFDFTGRRVFEQNQITTPKYLLNLQNFESGMYILKLSNSNEFIGTIPLLIQ